MRRPELIVAALAAALATASVAGCTSSQPSASPTASSVSATASTLSRSIATTSPVPLSTSARPTPSGVSRAHAVPSLRAVQRAEGLVDVRTVDADAVVDLRYATTGNFTHVQLYPRDARCLVHQTMAAGLRTAAEQLRRQGFLLVFWDCYRPHAVQVRMFQVVPNPDWVARPGSLATSHESARSVDVTLAYAAPRSCAAAMRLAGHCLVDMGTGFDDFTPKAYAFTTSGLTAAEVADRAVLRHAMNAGGLSVYSGEWWHFDGPGSLVGRPILQSPVD